MGKRGDGYPDYYAFMGHGRWLPTSVKKKLVELISDEEMLERVPVVEQGVIPVKARRAIVLDSLRGETRIFYLKKDKKGRYTVYVPVGNNKGKFAVLKLYKQ